MKSKIKPQDFYNFRLLLQEIEYKKGQYKVLDDKLKAPSASNISGMPKDIRRPNRMENLVNQKIEIAKVIDKLILKAKNEKRFLDEVAGMLLPEEKTVIQCRYFYLFDWKEINGLLHGDLEDFDVEEESKYLKRTYSIHKRALRKIQ